MNSVNSKIVSKSTKTLLRALLFSFFSFVQVKVSAIEIDFSRRGPASVEQTNQMINQQVVIDPSVKLPTKNVIAQPSSVKQNDFVSRQNDEEILQALKRAVLPLEPSNEIVILNTETGFIPEKIKVRKGEAYKIHIVNLNMREKNVSFLMDAFTQSHNTVFGVKKTFNIEPQVEGIYSYQCPETGVQGQMVVIQPATEKRKLSSVENSNGE